MKQLPHLIFLLAFSLLLAASNAFCQIDNLSTDSLRVSRLQATYDSLQAIDSLKMARLEGRINELMQLAEAQAILIEQSKNENDSAVMVELERLRKQNEALEVSNHMLHQLALDQETSGHPVLLEKDTIFRMYTSIGSFTAQERASRIENHLKDLVAAPVFDSANVNVKVDDKIAEVMYEDQIILVVTEEDELLFEIPKEALARHVAGIIRKSITTARERSNLINVGIRIGLTLLTAVLLYFMITYLNKGFSWLLTRFVRGRFTLLKPIKIRDYEILSAERQKRLIVLLFKVLKWVLIALVVYLALPLFFSIFPATEGIARQLLNYILDPFKAFILATFNYIPELITIIVILVIAHYLVKAIRFFSQEVAEEKLHIPGFYPDWALPTFNLLRFIIYIFSFVVIFPYLPGSDSEVFRGVSVFLGLLISIGSSTAIGNLVAGLVITYMRAFRIGDRVRIGDTLGDVVEKTMLITRLRTIKNEVVTIPNSAILTGHTINYSTSSAEEGLILNTTVTIGYDIPWKTVEKLLVQAAINTQYIEKEPQPFVLQTGLEDFYISYQINAFTRAPERAAAIYSELHSRVQDQFSQAGLEILSPHYRAMRDGNESTVPPSGKDKS